MPVLLGLCLLCPGTPAAAAEPQLSVSTGTRVPRAEQPFSVTITQNHRDRRLELGYSLRWDFHDLLGAGPGLLQVLGDPASVWRNQSWDIRDNTRFVIDGMRVDPWKAFYEATPPAAVATSSAAAAGTAAAAAPRRRFHPSLWPFLRDFNDHIADDIRAAALRETLHRLPPDAQKRSVDDEQSFLRDIIDWQRDEGVPGLAGAADGLEYLAPARPRGAAARDGVHFSTGSLAGQPAR